MRAISSVLLFAPLIDLPVGLCFADAMYPPSLVGVIRPCIVVQISFMVFSKRRIKLPVLVWLLTFQLGPEAMHSDKYAQLCCQQRLVAV